MKVSLMKESKRCQAAPLLAPVSRSGDILPAPQSTLFKKASVLFHPCDLQQLCVSTYNQITIPRLCKETTQRKRWSTRRIKHVAQCSCDHVMFFVNRVDAGRLAFLSAPNR